MTNFIMYGQKLVKLDNVKKYLNYSDKAGNLMVDDAIDMANKKYKFIVININEESV